MRRLAPTLIVGTLFLAACSDRSIDLPTAPAAVPSAPSLSNVAPACTADTAHITALIDSLFDGGNHTAVTARWQHIIDLLNPPAPYDPAAADSSTYDLAGYILEKYASGSTVGGQSTANGAKVTSLLNQMFCVAGIDAHLPGLGPDQGAGLYTPTSPATVITTGNQQGGISLPPGSGNVTTPTLITINRVPAFPGPLLTQLDQYPIFYEVNSSSGEAFANDAVVGVCSLASDVTRLRVAHNVPEPTPNTIEILPLAPAPFLDCSNAALGLGPRPSLGEFAGWGVARASRMLQTLLAPAPLSAAGLVLTTGLGGTTKQLSPFGTVDTLAFETAAAPTTGQRAPEGGAVAAPPAVMVKAPSGRGMPGITVTFTVSGGGGTLTPVGGTTPSLTVTGITDDTGYVATGNWILGTGANTVVAVATPPHPRSGVAPASGITFSATANPPVKLAFGTQPVTHVAGTPFGVTVLVQDVDGTTVPASSAGVTLSLNGGPAGTLQGTVTVSAVSGVATFSGLNITRAGTGYALGAASAPLAGVTSNSFDITPAAPATVAINAGNGQTAAEGTTLGVAAGTVAPSVRITDAYGNPVPNIGVTFAVASGGGSAMGTNQTTNGGGIAAVGGWTIVAGTNTLVASAPSMGPLAFVEFTATGTSVTDVLLNCPASAGNGDELNRAFYWQKPGGSKMINQVTLYLASNDPANIPTPYAIELQASAESYGAVPFGTSRQTVYLRGNASQNLATQFVFPNSVIPNGTKNVAFQFRVISNPNNAKLFFAKGPSSCTSVTETSGVLPLPLSTKIGTGVGIKILGN
jgi:hypothetical protein